MPKEHCAHVHISQTHPICDHKKKCSKHSLSHSCSKRRHSKFNLSSNCKCLRYISVCRNHLLSFDNSENDCPNGLPISSNARGKCSCSKTNDCIPGGKSDIKRRRCHHSRKRSHKCSKHRRIEPQIDSNPKDVVQLKLSIDGYKHVKSENVDYIEPIFNIVDKVEGSPHKVPTKHLKNSHHVTIAEPVIGDQKVETNASKIGGQIIAKEDKNQFSDNNGKTKLFRDAFQRKSSKGVITPSSHNRIMKNLGHSKTVNVGFMDKYADGCNLGIFPSVRKGLMFPKTVKKKIQFKIKTKRSEDEDVTFSNRSYCSQNCRIVHRNQFRRRANPPYYGNPQTLCPSHKSSFLEHFSSKCCL